MIYRTCKYIFLTTTTVYVLTLIFASYVGVYLTYVAVPVIILSGLLTFWLEPEVENATVEKTSQERLLEIEKRLKELK